MILFPAIDLKDGQVVRLLYGDMDAVTVYGDNPGAQAAAFADTGFDWLHVVDLNGAIEGRPVNREAVEAIRAAFPGKMQLGGGIRSLENIEAWLKIGVDRVILGTIAARDPELVHEACRRFPGQIVVGIDAKGGKVAVEGWVETGEMTALDLAQAFETAGVAAIVFTDIDRDGALTGVNLEATVALADAVSIPVIASGGVADIEDIRAVKAARDAGANLEGAISGRALYDGRLDARDALALIHA
ncbi:MAG: 1-(5-phosphoribosyl)-5-[(5-phosphoribosylamino)methylideneamino]imidazole-4-carboxamide isomerase [Geminicoccus sp.]|nr:1-(5-phosphoribosyl)-5-[(5-phosphoribosylamino)methylideneamino]imidazole-4-carboxamide isomerase [Geminicoccus sp.]HCI00519.1 1-(5-phosphoribosyl)-5-[(5-phosphoribosylamino)methylideneamino]imidazole-4-carboxamide isomerase [Alphaproteobacteria bacterium]